MAVNPFPTNRSGYVVEVFASLYRNGSTAAQDMIIDNGPSQATQYRLIRELEEAGYIRSEQRNGKKILSLPDHSREILEQHRIDDLQEDAA